jgi:hypothetical protein
MRSIDIPYLFFSLSALTSEKGFSKEPIFTALLKDASAILSQAHL